MGKKKHAAEVKGLLDKWRLPLARLILYWLLKTGEYFCLPLTPAEVDCKMAAIWTGLQAVLPASISFEEAQPLVERAFGKMWKRNKKTLEPAQIVAFAAAEYAAWVNDKFLRPDSGKRTPGIGRIYCEAWREGRRIPFEEAARRAREHGLKAAGCS